MVLSSPNKDIEDLFKLETGSNYGSEFGADDETALALLLSQAEAQHLGQVQPVPAATRESIENEDNTVPQIAYDKPATLTSPRTRQYVDEDGIPFQALAFDGPLREASVEVEYDARNRVAFSRKPATF